MDDLTKEYPLCIQCPNVEACTDSYKKEVATDGFCELKQHWTKYIDKCEA